MTMFRYVSFAVFMTACLYGSAGADAASVGFNPKIQSSAMLPDGAVAFFASAQLAESCGSKKAMALNDSPGRRLFQSGSCPLGQVFCAGASDDCMLVGWNCCSDGSGACEPGTQCFPDSDLCCLPGFKPCDNQGCIPQASTCCNWGTGQSCKPATPKCADKAKSLCTSTGNMAQAKIGMVLGSLVAVVLLAMIVM